MRAFPLEFESISLGRTVRRSGTRTTVDACMWNIVLRQPCSAVGTRVESRMCCEPTVHLWGFVRGGVVQDQVHVEIGGHFGVDRPRNARNSVARCRECRAPMTLPRGGRSAASERSAVSCSRLGSESSRPRIAPWPARVDSDRDLRRRRPWPRTMDPWTVSTNPVCAEPIRTLATPVRPWIATAPGARPSTGSTSAWRSAGWSPTSR